MITLRYTKDIYNRLTIAQRIFYEKNGYLVFPGLISQDVIDECHKRFDDIIEGKYSCDEHQITVMYDVKDKKSVNKIQNINYDPIFRHYIEHKKILDIVECFTGPNILAIHNMLIAKPPDIGFGSSRHPPHQDLYYMPIRPADRIVAAWTAMEPCDSENGCLFVAPSIKEWVNLEMRSGDTVFFHPLLIHGSGVNKSKRTRRAISCHYSTADCEIVDDDPTQDVIRNEILAYARKKYKLIDLTYPDIWRFKSSLVRGLRSSF